MKAIQFKDANTNYAEDQEQYKTLPTLKLDGEEGYVISCWKLNFWERIQVLFFGRIWVSLMTHNKPLTPSYLSAFRQAVFSKPRDSRLWSKFLNLLTSK